MSIFRRGWRAIKRFFTRKRVNHPAPVEEKPPVKPTTRPRRRRGALKTNAFGILLITRFEGFYSHPYLCPAGVPTIGYGTIVYPNGKKVTLNDPPCTRKQAKSWLAWELRDKEDKLNEFLLDNNIQVTSNQFSALISFAYNLGIYRVIRGSIAEALKAGDMDRVAKLMSQYNKARNRWGVLRELRGLTRRRKAEIELFYAEDKKENE